jgi:hypothetical protein
VKVSGNDFRFGIRGKIMIANEQIKTVQGGILDPNTLVIGF